LRGDWLWLTFMRRMHSGPRRTAPLHDCALNKMDVCMWLCWHIQLACEWQSVEWPMPPAPSPARRND
jgi:hypothetical protein